MSPATRALLARFRRQTAALEPDLRRAWLRGVARLQAQVSETELVRILRSQAVDQLIADLYTGEAIERAFAELRVGVRDGVATTATAFQRELPKAAVPGIAFDVLSPHVVTAIRTLDTKVMQGLVAEVQATVRQHVQAGLEAGEGPAAIARGVRSVLGLAPNQEAAVRNFEALLRAGDRAALTRALRDRRFDATLKRAFAGDGLSEAQITRMATAYRRRMVAFNASTHARTAALDATKRGQALAWQQAVEQGFVDGSRLMKRWASVGDDRVRPAHVAMNGEVVPADQPYSNGEQTPGESTYNCRCLSAFFLARGAAV
jgi:hypothetical protein